MTDEHIPRIYDAIPDVIILDDHGRRTGELHVVAYPCAPAPVTITIPGGASPALTLEQLDALVEQLQAARADVVRIQITAFAGGRAVARG